MASELTSEAAGLQMAISEQVNGHVAEGIIDTVPPVGSTSDQDGSLEKSLSSSSLSSLSAKASEFVPQTLLRTCLTFQAFRYGTEPGVISERKHDCITVQHWITFLYVSDMCFKRPCGLRTCDVSFFQEHHLSRCHLTFKGAPPSRLALLPRRFRTLFLRHHIRRSGPSLDQWKCTILSSPLTKCHVA